ncbi:hypothetical protein RHSIM_Rhsim11G0180900 [Rhododendron simsii]|uniref:Homeobox domain-containing protein n=1 Tax=Rhododendron simsii TaxID=118357 RepID=A0A834G6L5_RHOSS|nr:hypothetical protein RHSIM_Rhsim11G0180900 [Rhododendron simsii]
MATFFPNSSDQREAAPMIYSRESLPSSYSEAPVISANMMMYMNYLSSPGSDALAATSQQNSCNDIPPVGDSVSNHFGGSRMGEHDFHEWGNGRSEMSFMPPMGGATGLLQSMQNLQGQGLSLSLSTQLPSAMQMPSIDYRNPNSGFSAFLNPNLSISGEGSGNSDNMKSGISPYEMSSISRTVPNSKYLKAAQQLLDEVVTVRKALKPKESKKDQMKSSNEGDGGSKDETSNPQQESVNDSPKDLPAAERQGLQDKLTKLLSLLDEVDKRYKQYYHQMQIVVSSFDVIAGCGAAKPYTALALQTISRHFRCLRDAITGQIRVLRKNLGEQDTSDNGKGVGISRLRYVDQHLRQQRALQQLGMMQQHAWRPQRGLPESSVSILRAWLFEHFLHPYPKDSDKSMLARQTGLTRSQVSNWFINARVRLWKPMVEEMYKEETGDAEMDSNSSSEGEPKATKGDITACEDRNEDFKQSATSVPTERHGTGQYLDSKHNLIPHVEMVGTETEYGVLRSKGEQRLCLDDSNLFPNTIVQSDGGSGRFMISELGSFGNGNGVSLTLGLQHREGDGFPMTVDTHHGFVTMRGDEVYNTAPSSVGPQTTDFDCMDSGNRSQRFGSSHMFHDFVA